MSISDLGQRKQSSIVDNISGNDLHSGIIKVAGNGRQLCVASAFFSLDALNLIAEHLQEFESMRLLFGSDAAASQRNMLLAAMRRRSEVDLLAQRTSEPLLGGLDHARKLIEAGKVEARVYTKAKFHAKAYLAFRSHHPPYAGFIGSGNFTRQGLTQNIELNVELSTDQAQQLKDWFDERWAEAEEDEVLDTIKSEIDRHLKLYEPRAIYLKALLEWGDHVQGRTALKPLDMLSRLDPHQVHAYRQALRILDREPGVMICDGVGLGKSFVALALMEHWLREGSRVLLIAPKAVLKSSWEGYLGRYLSNYSRAFANLHSKPMTWFGFDPQHDEEELEELREYAEQADVIIVDESHNFRNSATKRYQNLYKVVAPNERGRKKIVLLTATPVNTSYEDLTNQFQILTHEEGEISGIARLQLNRQARNRDKEVAKQGPLPDQDSLFDYDSILADKILGVALQSVAIQRSRKTCRELAHAAGKQLRFPKRRTPQEVRYTLGSGHEALIREANLRFEELGRYLASYTAAVQKAADKDTAVDKNFGSRPQHGLKFSGYLPNLFLKTKTISNRQAQVEAFLAKMVYVNVMKQLESSTPAFQSIIESLGQGLALRLRNYCGDDPVVQSALSWHEQWMSLPENYAGDGDLGEEPEDAAADEASGGETDDYICREERRAIKRLKSLGFSEETHDIYRWRDDILNDLDHLQSIHDKCINAQREPDAKLVEIANHVAAERKRGRKVLIFTQSRKTADYIQAELQLRLAETVGLVNAAVGGDTRARILNAFSPKYNDLPSRGRNREMKPLPEMHILVSTDVLSEGVNLQEAGCILNYDLHWNPTRLIQRIGRVDRRLREEDPDHEFDILNVFPPSAINQVIRLIDTVEHRQRKIGRLLGIDVSFFKTDDEEGTLKEFNALYEGGETPRESQLIEYVRQTTLTTKDKAIAESLPAGAFGVWANAPFEGHFGLFRISWRKPEGANAAWKPEDTIPAADLKKFGQLIGAPRLLMLKSAAVRTPSSDAPGILETLSATAPGEKSGWPRDPAGLKDTLYKLREAALKTILDRTQNVTAELVCWMELQKNG